MDYCCNLACFSYFDRQVENSSSSAAQIEAAAQLGYPSSLLASMAAAASAANDKKIDPASELRKTTSPLNLSKGKFPHKEEGEEEHPIASPEDNNNLHHFLHSPKNGTADKKTKDSGYEGSSPSSPFLPMGATHEDATAFHELFLKNKNFFSKAAAAAGQPLPPHPPPPSMYPVTSQSQQHLPDVVSTLPLFPPTSAAGAHLKPPTPTMPHPASRLPFLPLDFPFRGFPGIPGSPAASNPLLGYPGSPMLSPDSLSPRAPGQSGSSRSKAEQGEGEDGRINFIKPLCHVTSDFYYRQAIWCQNHQTKSEGQRRSTSHQASNECVHDLGKGREAEDSQGLPGYAQFKHLKDSRWVAILVLHTTTKSIAFIHGIMSLCTIIKIYDSGERFPESPLSFVSAWPRNNNDTHRESTPELYTEHTTVMMMCFHWLFCIQLQMRAFFFTYGGHVEGET